jgi:hypothetical protein
MKNRLFKILAVLVVLASLIPTTAAFASTDHEMRFTGAIQSMPRNGGLIGVWKVGGRTVHVSAATQIDQSDGAAAKGAKVVVEGLRQKDGSINATSIDVLPTRPSP